MAHRFYVCLTLIFFVSASPAVERDQSAQRREFSAAWQRVGLNQPDLPDSAALKTYLIFDYLAVARFRRDLVTSPSDELDDRVGAFLRGHADEPVGRGLNGDWLASLTKRQRWERVLAESHGVTEARAVCDRLAARLALNDLPGLAADALVRWSLAAKQPVDCDPVFDWLRKQGLVTPAIAENRARAALAAGNWKLGREFALEVPEPWSGALLQWAQILQMPKDMLTRLFLDPAVAIEPAILVAGFLRLSLVDARAALNLLPDLSTRADVTSEMRGQMQRATALGLAYSRDLDSLAAFDNMPESLADTAVHEWRVRAALWAGNFHAVEKWIARMPPALAAQPRWRYWRARAIAQISGGDNDRALFAELAATRDFYGYLAADRLRQNYALNDRRLTVDKAQQAALEADVRLMRARELWKCDLVDSALAEWNSALAAADTAVKAQAAIAAAGWGWYEQSIVTLVQAGQWDDLQLRYPRPFATAAADAARLSGIPADWVFAVMRQESLFRRDAVSRSGALGLMQVLPTTAKEVARRRHIVLPARDAMFEPQFALMVGAARLRELLDRNEGHLPLSLAAYNAGPVAVNRWRPATPVDADIWIENIPYPETRSYVQHILEHIIAYAFVGDEPLPRLSDWMKPVTASPAIRNAADAPPSGP